MNSKARANIDLTCDNEDDTDEQHDTTPGKGGRSWLTEELLGSGVPEFGLEQWLLHFMREALKTEMSDSQLLNFFCLARDRALGDEEAYVTLLTQVETLICSRMPEGIRGTLNKDDDSLPGYEPDRSIEALKDVCVGHMPDRHLLEMFDLSATMRAEPEVGHMWEAVMYLSRAQILRRMNDTRLRKMVDDAGQKGGNDPGDARCQGTRTSLVNNARVDVEDKEFHAVSLRNALRIAEDSFQQDMTDEKLFDLYILVKECGTTELNIFEELASDVTALLFKRLNAGSADPALDGPICTLDYPDEGVKVLRAILRGDQPHRNLLMYYRMTWDDMRTGDTWTAIADLSRAQILRRMRSQRAPNDLHFGEWKLLELTQRILRHR